MFKGLFTETPKSPLKHDLLQGLVALLINVPNTWVEKSVFCRFFNFSYLLGKFYRWYNS